MSAISSQHPKYRTKLCRNFANGNCPFGHKCSFVHPAPVGVNLLTSSLAQYLFNWNMLLPQLLALSNQQATLKGSQRRSSPRSQEAQLVDEDPSPASSLLLSMSDGTSSEQASQTRLFGGRKRLPCRQFIRTGGCPAGANCRLCHDVTALPSADSRKLERAPPYETDMPKDGGRTISGGVLMGVKLPSPPTINQECSDPPRYTEAEPAQPYQSPRYPYLNVTDHGHFVDQPLYWPGYIWQPYRPCYATAAAAVPASTTMTPSSTMQHGTYHPLPPPPAQNAPSTGVQASLPLGAYEVDGTTYFPTRVPSVPAPAPVTCSVPVRPGPYSHTMVPVYPYYAPPPVPASHYDAPNQTTDACRQACFDPFFSDPMMPSELPVASRHEDYHMSLIQRDSVVRILASPLTLAGDVGSTTTTTINVVDKPMPTVTHVKDHEFPYQPPKNQQVGHARRISVNIKKQGRTSSG